LPARREKTPQPIGAEDQSRKIAEGKKEKRI